MMEDLTVAWRQGQLTDIAFHFSGLIARLDPAADDAVVLAAALTSNYSVSNQVCLDLSQVAGKSVFSAINGKEIVAPQLSNWISVLRQSRVVATNDEYKPLVLESNNRLYLYRYWKLEQRLSELLHQRAASSDFQFDSSKLSEAVSLIFPPTDRTKEQCEVAELVVRRPFVVVSGGPGTGKTTTIVHVLGVLVEMGIVSSDEVVLSAPTGKAAARLLDVVVQKSRRLESVSAPCVYHASTLHRLLGWNRGGIRSSSVPSPVIPYEVVVVDEASMVDLTLMTHLLERLSPKTRLILVGDRNQLTSVGMGSVLGDICSAAESRSLKRSMVVLRNCWRFSSNGQFASFAKAVNSGESERAQKILDQPKQSDLIMRSIENRLELSRLLEKHCIRSFADAIQLASTGVQPDIILKKHCRLKLLTAHRKGFRGSDQLNRLVEEQLSIRGFVPPSEAWYIGRPVLITKNNYDLQLFNGDIGVVLPDNEEPGITRVVFPKIGGGWRQIHPRQLPEHETVYATTIHKSQGSEYEHVIIVLPETFSSILSRELIYTAVTRATTKLEIWGRKEILKEAILYRAQRVSGLRDQLSRFNAVE